MRLLIAGWQGQVARSLVELALKRKDVTALSVGRPALDLCQPSSIKSTLVGDLPDVMINTAAYTAVDRAEAEPDAVFRLNSAGAAAFAEAGAKRGIPIIHLSTDYVFDGNKTAPYTEDDEPAPQSVYGRSKLQSESAVAEANPHHVILRTAWVHSPFGRNFVKTMLDLAETRDEINVVDDQTGSPTYAPHLAEAILGIAQRIAKGEAPPPWGLYHAANSGAVTWCGLARKVFEVSRASGGPSAKVNAITTAEYPTAAPRPANSRLDCTRLAETFGITLPAWEHGVEDCVKRLLEGTDAQHPARAGTGE